MSIHITLPDGSRREFATPPTVQEVAAAISKSLAKAAIAGEVDGKMVDLSYLIESDAALSVVTAKDDAGLEVLRHSTAHLLAQAVKALHPEAQVTIGPVIDDGFYYDFAFHRPFTPEDLTAIEAKMRELAKQDFTVSRRELPRDQAITLFQDMGEHYKAEIIASIPQDETLSLYQQGDFEDLCRGPHVPSTRHLKVFKLLKVAGAYWRGDASNEMLQRIYGTAWASQSQLDDYLYRLEEAEKRDHRKLGKRLNLFHFQEEAPGMAFWHEKGWQLYRTIESYIRDKLSHHGYQEVRTPQVVDKVLWEKSGHWENYHDDMFVTETEHRTYAIKPMNCPCHVQIFNQGVTSYRELPVRMAEFGNCHRCEASGALHGLMRVRNFTQDDAHIFCTTEQIESEVDALIELIGEVYHDFGFDEILYKLATRPEKRVGKDDDWDRAEQALTSVLERHQLDWSLSPGEGAFYGPKIEFSLRDCLGRIWQCATIQIDFSMPERLDASYIDEHGQKQRPVMIHRALLGSIERFIGILIEQTDGHLPVWLSPVQSVIMNITDNQADYANKVCLALQDVGIKATKDLRNEKISFKIRQHSMARIPFLLVVGDREQEQGTVSVRSAKGDNLGVMAIEAFIEFFEARRNRPLV